MAITVHVQVLPNGEGLELPEYQTDGASGMDLRAALPEHAAITIAPSEYKAIHCGVALAIPDGYEANVRARSGLAVKYGIHLLGGVSTFDADYRGEIGVLLKNSGPHEFTVRRGMRIAQVVFSKVEYATLQEVPFLSSTRRGTSGCGSTGLG